MSFEFYCILVFLFLLAHGLLFLSTQCFKTLYWVILSVFYPTKEKQICVDIYQPQLWL